MPTASSWATSSPIGRPDVAMVAGVAIGLGLWLLAEEVYGGARRRRRERREREWDTADAQALAVLRHFDEQGEPNGTRGRSQSHGESA